MGGLHAALGFLNSRTPHRFTGVYQYDDQILRNRALFDRWDPSVTSGPDAPMRETFCALVPASGTSLEVVDGRADKRFPWMSGNAVVCYCGAMIQGPDGTPFGTVCHFDLQPCEAGSTQIPLLLASTRPLYDVLNAATPWPRA